MDFTKEETLAIAGIMYHIMYSDFIMTNKELEFFRSTIHVSRETLDEARKMPVLIILNTLMFMSEPKKKIVGDLVKGMSFSDKKLTEREVKMLTPLLYLLGQTP